MLDISKIHSTTIGACIKYGIDISQYDSLEELRAMIKQKYNERPEIKNRNVGKYKTDPERYREYKRKSLAKLKAARTISTDPNCTTVTNTSDLVVQ